MIQNTVYYAMRTYEYEAIRVEGVKWVVRGYVLFCCYGNSHSLALWLSHSP